MVLETNRHDVDVAITEPHIQQDPTIHEGEFPNICNKYGPVVTQSSYIQEMFMYYSKNCH